MTFTEKLRRAAAEVNKSKLGQAVGLGANTISSYIAKGSVPRADIALKIARAVSVPLEWLTDDAQSWPPPAQSGRSLADVPYTELARELGRRYRLEVLDAVAGLDQAEREDWDAAAAAVRSLKPGADPPPSVVRLLMFQSRLIDSVATVTARYDVRLVADFMHDQMRGGDRPVESVQYAKAVLRLNDLEARDGFGGLLRWSLDHADEIRRLGVFKKTLLTTNWLMQLTHEQRRGELLAQPPEGPATDAGTPTPRVTKRATRKLHI